MRNPSTKIVRVPITNPGRKAQISGIPKFRVKPSHEAFIAYARFGAKIKWADIDPETLVVSIDAIKKLVS